MKDRDIKLCLKLMKVWSKIKVNIINLSEENGLTMQQTGLLHKLYEKESILMGALAKQLHCDASNVTGIVDRLESRGLITRQDLPNDRRAKELRLTQDGRKIIESMLKRLPDGIDLDKLSDKDAKHLDVILSKMITDTPT